MIDPAIENFGMVGVMVANGHDLDVTKHLMVDDFSYCLLTVLVSHTEIVV